MVGLADFMFSGQITCGSLGLFTATVKLIDIDGREHIASSVGTGSVDAAYKEVDLIVKVPIALLEYSMSAIEGIDAIASTRVLIRWENDLTRASKGHIVQPTFSGTEADMDIVVSSVQGYVNG